MTLDISISSRDDFVNFGKALAVALKEYNASRRYVISLSGDADSGKSLIALAADFGINPDRYPNGLGPDCSINALKSGVCRDVFFSDGLPFPDLTNFSRNYAKKWEGFYNDHSGIRLFILSNVWNWANVETGTGARSESDASKLRADIEIKTECIGNPSDFRRTLTMQIADAELERHISKKLDLVLPEPACARPAGFPARPAARDCAHG